ncbi:MAG: hypothetical protein LLG14_16560 [Nocardiaceae bacterium]|nr:hypothetical protein [Nocardiaceae bacterium]
MTFTVTASATATSPITVSYVTANGTAKVDTDYQFTTGKATIPDGQKSTTINVPVIGDTTKENNETFTVRLSSPIGARILTAAGTGTITNDDTDSTLTRTLTVAKSGNGSGKVTSSPAGIDCGTDCSEDFKWRTQVTLTAMADAGSEFTGWSGACSNTSGSCVVTMNEATSVTATFRATQFQLTVIRALDGGPSGGTVYTADSVINCGEECTATFNAGTKVDLLQFTNGDALFTGFDGPCDPAYQSECLVTMDQAVTVTAHFATNRTYSVSITGAGKGGFSITWVGPRNTGGGSTNCPDCRSGSGPLPYGSVVTFKAVPDSGSRFTGWSGDCSGDECVVTLDRDISVVGNLDRTTG